jgi:hypothetical protein
LEGEDLRMSVRGFASAHRAVLFAIAVLGIALVVFVGFWFQPQKIFLENTIN